VLARVHQNVCTSGGQCPKNRVRLVDSSSNVSRSNRRQRLAERASAAVCLALAEPGWSVRRVLVIAQHDEGSEARFHHAKHVYRQIDVGRRFADIAGNAQQVRRQSV
jgi:hypothetical protein